MVSWAYCVGWDTKWSMCYYFIIDYLLSALCHAYGLILTSMTLISLLFLGFALFIYFFFIISVLLFDEACQLCKVVINSTSGAIKCTVCKFSYNLKVLIFKEKIQLSLIGLVSNVHLPTCHFLTIMNDDDTNISADLNPSYIVNENLKYLDLNKHDVDSRYTTGGRN